MVSGMSDVGIPDDIRDFVKQASTGLTRIRQLPAAELTKLLMQEFHNSMQT